MIIVKILIVFFVCFISYCIYSELVPVKTMEGFQDAKDAKDAKEYRPYNLNDPNSSLILAQQNAGNIEVLKGRMDRWDDVTGRINDMEQNIQSMQVQIDGLVQQQLEYAQELAGSTPVEVTGTESLTIEDEEEK